MKKGMLRAAMAVVLVLAAVGSCSNPASGLGRRVDVNPPSILIDSPVSGTNFKGVQAFVGRYFDDLEVATVEVSFDNGTTFLPATLTNAAGKLTEGTWNLNYDSTAFPDGGKLVVVRVTDKAGRATTTNPSIYTTDNTPPTVLVTSPADYGTARPDLSSVLSLEGRAYDNDYSPLQIQKVFVTVLNPDGTPASVKKEAKGKESWSVQFLFPATNGETNDDFPGGLSDQPAGIVYGYSVEAVDGAGNLNNHIYHAADLFKLLQSGQLFPSMNALGTLDQKGTGTLEGVGANPTGLTFDELKALRITKDSGVSSGFKFFRDVDKPVVEVTNLVRGEDQVYPVINSRSSVSGTVTDDKKPFKWDPSVPANYDAGYLSAVVTPAGSTSFTIIPAAPPKTRGQGNMVNFQFDLVYPSGHPKAGQTFDNGIYNMVIKTRDADWVVGSARNEGQVSVSFRVDNSAPAFLSINPGTGAEMGGAGNKVELTVEVEDDSPNLTLEVDHGAVIGVLSRLPADGVVSNGAGTEVVKDNKTFYQKSFTVTIPLEAGQQKVFAKLAVKDEAGFIGYSSDLEYTIDEIPPEVTIDDIPGSISLFVGGGKATASVSGTGLGSNEVYFLVQAQGAAAPVAGTGTWLKATGNTKWNGTITLDSTTAFEGAYSLYAYSQDPAGNRSAVAREDFMVDQAAPSVTPVGLNASQITYKTTTGFNIEATITDSFGLKTWNAGGVLIIVDNGATLGAITKTGDVYSRTFSGVDGTYNVTIVAEDLAGKTTTIQRTIVVDTTPPVITVANLNAGQNTAIETSTFTIRGTAEDASEVKQVQYSLDEGVTWTNVTTGTVSWSVVVTGLAEGSGKKIRIRARDEHDSGFATPSHFTVTGDFEFSLDLDPPVLTDITIDGTPLASWVSGTPKKSNFSINGKAIDGNGISSLQLSLDGGVTWLAAVTVNPDTTWSQLITVGTVGDGLKPVKIRAMDPVNKVSTADFSVLIDTVAPTITPTTIASNQNIFFESAPYTFQVKGVWLDNSGPKYIDPLEAGTQAAMEFSLDGGTTWNDFSTVTSSQWQDDIAFPIQGTAELRLRATDYVGNVSSVISIGNITVDHARPTVTLNAVGNFQNGGFTLSGGSSDSNALQNITVTSQANAGIGTISFNSTTGVWSVPVLPTVDGTYIYTITAVDVAGRQSVATTKTITFDTTAPVLTVSNLVDNASVDTSTYPITGTVSDINGFGNVEYSVNSGSTWATVSSPGQVWTHTATGLMEGTSSTIRFRVTDSAGNVTVTPSSGDIDFSYDGADPRATENNYTSTLLQSKSTALVLNGLADDAELTPGRQAASVTIKVNHNGTQVHSGNLIPVNDADGPDDIPGNSDDGYYWTYTLTPGALSGDGFYTVTVTVTDSAVPAKTSEVVRNFQIDTTTPALTVTNPTNNIVISSPATASSFIASGSLLDLGGVGFDSVNALEYSLNGAAAVDISASLSGTSWNQGINLTSTAPFDVGGIGDQGIRKFQFTARDKVGNVTVGSVLSVIYDTAPPSLSVDGSVSSSPRNTDWTLFGTASDSFKLNSVIITATKDGISQGEVYNNNNGSSGWSAGDTANWTHTLNATAGNQGNWVFTITATDAAGKTKVTTKSVTMDTTKPTAAVTTPADSTYHGGPLMAANGTVSDASNQIASVQYRVDGGTWTAVSGGTLSWFANIDLDTDGAGADAGLAVGSHTLQLRATDAAGNVGDPTAALTFFVDQANPTLTETAAGGNVSRSAAFTLSGVATDDVQLDTIAVTQNGTSITTNPGTLGAGTWSITGLPRTGAGLGTTTVASGVYNYAITLTDKAGKTTTVNRSITVDVTPPDALAITAPGAAQTGLNALSGAAYTFRGTSSDAAGGVGMAKIWYVINTSATAPAGTAGYLDVATTGNWSFTQDLDTDGAGADTGLAEGLSYYLHVKAEDAAGNVQTAATSVLFDLDQSNPNLTETGINTTALSNRNVGFSLTGEISDTLASPVVAISVTQNGTLINTNSPSIVGTTWTLANLPRDSGSIGDQLLNDGIYEYVITATDGAGKTMVVNRTVRFDATAPTLAVSSPAPAEQIGAATTTLTGTVSDGAGSGVASVQYSADNISWLPATVVGGTWTKTGYDLVSEGAKALYVRATDAVGNVNALGVINFYYDLAAPTLSAGTPPAITNADVVLSGTASDSNVLASVVITATKNGVAQGTLHTDAASPDSWSYTHTAAGNDGTWVYTITATDAAGRTTTTSRTVLIDTIKPVVSITLPLASTYVGGTDVTATGSVTELNNLTSVEYTVNGSDWFAVSSGTSSWSINNVTGTLGEGVRTLQVRATDQAGNVSNASSRTLWVDTLSPGLTETGIGSGAVYKNALFTLSGDISDNVDLASITVTESKNGAAATTVYSNTYTGLLGGTPETSVGWSVASLPSGGASTGNYEYVITVADASGKTRSLTRTVTVDTTVPALAINSVLPIILPARQVNGWITLSANASDENGLDGVKYFTRTTATTPAWTDGDGTLDTVAPYTNALNTTALTDSTTYYLHVLTRDKSGNVSAVVYDVAVSQASDLPAISVESPGNGDAMGADKKVRGTFSDDDGVAANTAIFYYKKSTDGSWSNKTITNSSSASQLVSWTIDLTTELGAGGDGTYQYYVRVTDDATLKSGLGAAFTELGSSGSPRTFTFDNSPPTVSATLTKTPDQGAYKLGDAITISWTASDASGLQSQVFDIDGVSTGLGSLNNPSGTNYNVVYTVPASTSGTKTFTLVVTDTTGRSTTRTLNITVDVDAPTVENALTLDPAFVGSTPNGAFTLRGTAADNRGLNNVQVQVTGGEGTLTWTNATLSNGNWSYAIANSAVYESTSGNITVEVRAYDLAGNVSTTQSFVKAVDQAADKPVVNLLSPVASSSYGTTVQVSGTASDDDNLADINDNGIIDTDAIEIRYRGVAPVVGSVTVNPTIIGSGKSANFNASLTGLSSGTWGVEVRAKDDSGTWSDWTAEVVFTVDSGAPSLVVSTVVPTFTSNGTLALTGTVEDSSGVKYVQVRINGGTWQLVNAPGMVDGNSDGIWDVLPTVSTSWSINLNLGSDGLKTLEFQAEDASAFIANQQKSTTLDSTAPAGAFDSQFRDDPTGSFLSTSLLNKTVRITGTVTEDNLADSNPIRIRIDADNNGDFVGPNDVAYTAVTGTFVWSYVWNTSAVPNSNATLQLEITDKAGNVTSSITKLVTLNQVADTPVVTQAFNAAPTAGDAGLNVLGATLKVSGTLSDDDGFNANTVLLSLDGGAFSIVGTNTSGTTATWEYTWGTLAQGQHYYSVQATDRNGAVLTLGPTYFLVDTANPSLAITTPAAGAKVKAGTLSITGTASDAGGLGTTPLSLTLRHSNTGSPLHNTSYTPAVVAGDWSQDVTINTGSLDGTLYLDLVLTDRAGKQSSLTRAITIDTTSPTLNLNYPSFAAYINGLVDVTGTADDLNGLSDVTLQILGPVSKLPVANISRSGTTLAAWTFPLNSFTYATSTYGQDVNADGKLWRVWFRLAATDNSGNITELLVDDEDADTNLDDYPWFFIDTDGDKPTIAVTQPKNGDKIGGIVSMFGTATDDDGAVMQVEVQIDFNGDGDFLDSRDLNNNDSDSNPATGIDLGANQDIFGNTVKIGPSAHKWEDESAWYVVNVSNNSWTQELNSNGELYPTATGGSGLINMRVRSRDQFGLASEILTRSITLDQTFPRIENVTPLDQSYQSGTFNLVAEFGDNIDLDLGSLSQVRINIAKTGYQTLTAGPNSGVGHPYALVADLADPQNGFDLNYPIDTNVYFPGSSGILYVDLYVKDESSYVNQRSFTFYVDNQAPTGIWSDSTTRPDGSSLRNGMITVNGVDKTYVEGNYSDSGAVSGISHIEVYLVRGGAVRNIKANGTWGGATSTETIDVENYSLGTNTWTTVPNSAGQLLVTHASLGSDYVIRVDKPTEMSDLGFGTDIDGDGYTEYQGIYEGKARWRAYFDSQYLPDGIADLHYVIYDLAGNKVHRMRQVFIANSGPRVDQIQVGSDLNANGTVANATGLNEIGDYYNTAPVVNRSDFQKIKNSKLYLGVYGSDPNGTNQGVKQIFVDVYDAAGTTLFGNARTSALNPASGDDTITLTPTPGVSPWTTAYSGGTANFTLKVTVRDNDDISAVQFVKVSIIDPSDTTPPVVTLNALSVNDQDLDLGHLELQGDNTVAIWNTIKAAYGNDNDPKVSGQIKVKGSITDNNLVTSVQATSENNPTPALASWVGGVLTAVTGSGFTIDTLSVGENGTTVTFTYTWNTAQVTGTAGLDKILSLKAFDGFLTATGTRAASTITVAAWAGRNIAVGAPIYLFGGTSPTTTTVSAFNNGTGQVTLTNTTIATDNTSASVGWNLTHTASQQVDVVPYIKSIRRDSAIYNNYRSRQGWFGLRQNEANVTVTGFNIFNTTADTITFVGQAPALPAGSTATTVILPQASTSTISTGAVSVTVNGQPSINNLNDNSKAWNIEATASAAFDGSALWTDDRYVHVWRSDNNQAGTNRGYFTGSADPEYPAMTINTAGILYGSWSNYADSSVYYGVNNGAATEFFNSYDPSEHTDVSFGNRVTVVWNANTYGNGAWNSTGAGGVYVYDSQANAALDSNWGNAYESELLYHDQKLMQFVNQRVVNQGDNIHISYYDTDTKSLKYWYNTSGNNPAYAQTWVNIDGGSDTHDGTRLVANGSARVATAGEYSAIAVTPTTNYPVIAYYDGSSQTVKLARASAVNPAFGAWTRQTVMTNGVDPNYQFSGKYITMKIDSAGYLHLAFFRNSTGDLIYLKSTNNPTNGTTDYTFGNSVIVDSIGSVGVWADLTLNGTSPVISYLDSSLVNTFDGIKMAYYDPALEALSGDTSGQPDTSDGWEAMNAALAYEVESVRTSVETDTGTNFWQQAIGYSSTDFYRIGYYVR